MKLMDRIFRKKLKQNISPMPSWDKIVVMMYDKHLDTFADEVIKVVYSKDCAMRYVILKDEKGFFTYQLEVLYPFDEDEWKYICSHDDALPAFWNSSIGIVGKSIFENMDELLKEMKSEPEYKRYF